MTRLLLDSHVASVLAEQLRRRGVDTEALAQWKGGSHLNAGDDALLRLAHADRRVLVTFDCQTVPTLLREMAESGEHHGGVILVSSHTFRANNIGGLLSALLSELRRRSDEEWEDMLVYLRP